MRFSAVLLFSVLTAGDYEYVSNLAGRYQPKSAARYATVITNNAAIYRLPARRIARQIEKESWFDWTSISKTIIISNGIKSIVTCKDPSYGPMQVKPRIWRHVLYRIDNGDLAKELHRKQIVETAEIDKMFLRIGYGVEAGCFVMRYLLDKNQQNYPTALMEYWAGSKSKHMAQFRQGTNFAYVNHIMGW